ncbi:hypothetical protein DN069_19210 [Streptacidiphilus pinicola]|uniref:Uncharacterized protein n=1 Tax=Streptacidiphilus pinicola TaxID=2219663 RepID=A0A2X0IL11_9ACTN|nr:HAD-IA family hydrolase [Streptacidiphilus pinicola]RAG84031.1 hypothetical protein DN069_19210 [Streptacidiphilus pinicola]
MLLTPPLGDYHAYLFDCDGTVTDSMPQHYGVAPEHCLVFEDTDMGIQAATEAGMNSVRIPQRRTQHPLGGAR